MGLVESLKRIRGRKRHRGDRRKPPRRRRDPNWATLPGGSSTKEAGTASIERARELAD
jgi:hypothetical protein